MLAGLILKNDAADAVGRDPGGDLHGWRAQPVEAVPSVPCALAEAVVDEHRADRSTRLLQFRDRDTTLRLRATRAGDDHA